MLLLAGCFLTQSGSVPPAATNPPADSSAPSVSPTSSPSGTPSATPTAVAKACPPTPAVMPASATTRKTIDIDGDGHTDIEWLSETPSLRFGVTTASGATYSFPLSTAAPGAREGFIARLNDHRILSLVDDGRTAYLHFFVNCSWVQTKDSHGIPYTLDMNNFRNKGTGVGCRRGYLYSWKLIATGSTYTVKETQILLNVDGSVANNAPLTVLAKHLSATNPRVRIARMITCAGATVGTRGVTLP